jgi:hypothetical protein
LSIIVLKMLIVTFSAAGIGERPALHNKSRALATAAPRSLRRSRISVSRITSAGAGVGLAGASAVSRSIIRRRRFICLTMMKRAKATITNLMTALMKEP